MIQSIQKIIRIGSSGGVTIPAKEMRRQNIKFGDEVKISIEPVKKDINQAKLMSEYEKFVKQYGLTLKNLSGR